MKLILLKVHEEYETRFDAYVKKNGFYSIEVARTGDYLEYGHCLYLVYCNDEEAQRMIRELKVESADHCDESFTNIEMLLLTANKKNA